ncbi:MAG TPA: hypothetical protein ENN07_01265 [candidate division Zixibacteria bacterium]|nr:hypothetical protein [candidate division Zixibacteria bacterium]
MPNWFIDTEFAGYYFAKHYGIYNEYNLDAEILNFDYSYDAPASLSLGKLDFAVMSTSKFVTSCQMGGDLVALLAIFQYEPSVFIVKNNSGIVKPEDFKGKRIVRKNDDWEKTIERILSTAGLTLGDVILVPGGKDISPFETGDVDIWCGYAQDEPVEVELAGISASIIYAYDYGVTDYQGLLVTSREMIDREPHVVEAFVSASLRGWGEAIKNPEATIQAMQDLDTTMTITYLRKSFNKIIPFIHGGEMPVGLVDLNRWHKLMIENNLPAEDILRQEFAERFYYPEIQ